MLARMSENNGDDDAMVQRRWYSRYSLVIDRHRVIVVSIWSSLAM